MVSKVFSACDFNYFKQCVLNDGIGETGGNIGDGGSFLLGLLYIGIHENSTSRSKVGRIFGKQSLFGKIDNAVVQGFCKSLNERTAAGGAGFVKLYAVDGAVFNLDALHILSADIQNAVHIRFKGRRRIIVGDGFNLALIQHQRRFQQRLTVAGGTGVYDIGLFGNDIVYLLHCADCGSQRTAVIIAVKMVQQGSVFADKRHLCSGGTGVDAQIAVSLISGDIRFPDIVAFVASGKFGVSLFIFKERFHPVNLKIHLNAVGEAFHQALQTGGHFTL